VFTARYALSPYIKQIRFVFKGLIQALYFVQPTIPATRTAVEMSLYWTPCSQCPTACRAIISYTAAVALQTAHLPSASLWSFILYFTDPYHAKWCHSSVNIGTRLLHTRLGNWSSRNGRSTSYSVLHIYKIGARGDAVGWGTVLQVGRSRVRFPMVHYGPGVDSASNRNEYQEYFLGIKAAGALGWQPYHPHVTIVYKSGSLDLLEPSGPVQACNGIALSFWHLHNRLWMPLGFLFKTYQGFFPEA
jgi:hypothetical protein